MSANGRLQPGELTTVQGSMQLATDAAIDYLAMKRDAAKDGVTMTIAEPAGGYRSWATQVDMHNPARHIYYNITPGITILPAGQSTHGLGQCVDIAPHAAVAWVQNHGSKYGYGRRAINDPNCFRHVPGIHTTSLAGTGVPIPIDAPPTIHEEDDMPHVIRSIKDNLGTNVWPNGVYIVTAFGVVAAAATSESVINRLNERTATEEFYSSEVAELDERLRAAAARSNTSAPAVDVAALAAEIVKQLPTVSGITKADVVDALKSVTFAAK